MVREIPNATPFRVATFTRTIPPVPFYAIRDADRTFPHHAQLEEGSTTVDLVLFT